MRDITKKVNSHRTALAKALVRVSPATLDLIRTNQTPKPDVLQTARVAGIQAAKNTSQIIPYCHPLPLTHAKVDFVMDEDSIEIICEVKAIYKTGVEMEALTGASVAALTIYDMVKAVDEMLSIDAVRLITKTGGKSSAYELADKRKYKAAVLVLSDSICAGDAEDFSGKMIIERLTQEGLEVVDYKIIADDTNELHKEAMRCIEKLSVDLFITTGGTGVSPRDITAEALEQIIERDLPGVAEAIRSYGQERNPYSMLSRGMAGVRGKSVIISLPGSAGGVEDGMNAIFPAVFHSFAMLKGEGHGAAPSQSSAKNSLQNSANNDVNNDLKKDFKNSLRTSL